MHAVRDLRLLQLVSPSLPIGAFTYSQGLEWAVEAGWVSSEQALYDWLEDLLHGSICHVEVPVFARIHAAWLENDLDLAGHWIDYLLASRETSELKSEEQQRGRAFARLLPEFDLPLDGQTRGLLEKTQLAGFAYASCCWGIEPPQAIPAYLWGWLENLVLAGVKLIPLGQTAGQKILFRMSEQIPAAAEVGMALADEQIGFSSTAQAIACSLHETQYTRLYRS